jgi:ubiquitin-activating enzyme E1
MTKFIAGKIIPAIATTTALVTGLVCLEMYKLLDNKPFEAYRSSYVTLATNIFAASEPSPPQVTDVTFPSGLEWKWTLWDDLVIDLGSEPTLLDVIDYLQGEKYGAVVTAITLGTALVWLDFSPTPERAADEKLPLRQLVKELWIRNGSADDEPKVGQWVQLEVTIENDDGDDLCVPPCKVRVSGW